jgi:organizing structure protein 2
MASPSQHLDAEAAVPQDDMHAEPRAAHRKPIYDDDSDTPAPPPPPTRANPTSPSSPPAPTPTDRLAGHIGKARLAVYERTASLERSADALLARAFAAERTVADTVASLAPSRASGETLLPGAVYALVAAMGASIAVRGRGVVVRGAAPVVAGVVVAKALLPETCGNVERLVWRAEQKVPGLAEAHERAQERAERFVRTGLEHSRMGVQQLEDGVGNVRRKIEEWVSKGR